jgi:hypothetical protein
LQLISLAATSGVVPGAVSDVVPGVLSAVMSGLADVSGFGAASAADVLLLEQAVRQAHSKSGPTGIAEFWVIP